MPIVGIDLGTTNSLVGLIEKGRPRLFTDERGETLVPSVVDYSGPEPLVGGGAHARKSAGTADTLYSAKRFIGRGASDVGAWAKLLPFDLSASDAQMIRFTAGGRAVTPMEVSADILRKLKAMAESALGTPVDGAVITVPAYFNDSQRQATKFAGELAGLDVKRIVNEPTAACLAYGLDKKTMGNIAVFDLGGGTFDISILRVKDGVFEVLATNGDTGLGGDDFDHAIAEKLAQEMGVTADAALAVAGEKLKRALTESESAVFTFGRFSREVKRAELDAWLLPVLKRAEGPCRHCLKDSGLKAEAITDVILVGGSTRTPLVKKFVGEMFRREPICTLNPDEVVAMGAAVQANILSGQMGGMLLLDVIPLSLGIETMGGVLSRLIHRNATIPISASETFSTFADGQTAVAIHVLQGERELSADNRSLARFELRGLSPMPAGIPKIEVEFIVDANGILNVRAMELRTGQQASVLVNPSYGLGDTEIEQMLSDAFEHAEADFEARFLAEARTEADGLARAAKKSLAKGRGLIEEAEVAAIEKALADLEASLSIDDRGLIKRRIETVNETTRHLAEKLLNDAVSKALKDKEIAP